MALCVSITKYLLLLLFYKSYRIFLKQTLFIPLKEKVLICKMAGDKAVSTASKPMMRGLLNASIKKNLIIALTAAAITGVAFKEFVGSARKRRYAEFYRNYDAEKEFEEMKKKGLFQSC